MAAVTLQRCHGWYIDISMMKHYVCFLSCYRSDSCRLLALALPVMTGAACAPCEIILNGWYRGAEQRGTGMVDTRLSVVNYDMAVSSVRLKL